MPDYSNYNARTYEEYGKIWQNTGKCVFCDLKDKYIVKETKNMVLTVNIFPYILGHLLIIPKKHKEAFDDLDTDEFMQMKELAEYGKKLLKKVENIDDIWFLFRMPKGFTAQKTVAHVHAHLIPYHNDLFKWEFQNIDVPPADFAAKLRENKI